MEDDKFEKLMKEMSEIRKSHHEAEDKLTTSFRKEVNSPGEDGKRASTEDLEVWLHFPEERTRVILILEFKSPLHRPSMSWRSWHLSPKTKMLFPADAWMKV